MIPNRSQWKKWTAPSKASYVGCWLGGLSLVLGTVFYFFPYPGVLAYFGKSRIEIPGDGVLEQRLSLAQIEGVKYKNATHAFVIAKPVNLLVLNELTNPAVRDSWGNHLLLASVSPFMPSEQDTIFGPGDCRLLGKAITVDAAKMEATFEIETISCGDSRGDAYELTSKMLHSRRIAYLTRKDDLGNNRIPITWRKKVLTIDNENNVVVVFDSSVKQLKRMGKVVQAF